MQRNNSRPWSILVVISVLGAQQPALAASLSGNATATSDYVFRGISQTLGDPAVQAGLRVDSDSGAYASIWGSIVHFTAAPDASAEIDGVLGWRGSLGKSLVSDINLTRFHYPDASTSLSYTEVIATLTWRDRSWLLVGYSADVFASGGSGSYLQVGTKVHLADRVRIEAAAGYYALDDAYGRGYAHAQITGAWQPHPTVELRLTGHTADASARALFGEGVASPRIEAAIQMSF